MATDTNFYVRVKTEVDQAGLKQLQKVDEVINKMGQSSQTSDKWNKLTEGLSSAGRAAGDSSKSFEGLANNTQLSHMQMQVLASSARHTFDSLASGLPITTILMEQGTKLTAAFGSFGEAFRTIGPYVGIAAGAFAAFAIAAKAVSTAMDGLSSADKIVEYFGKIEDKAFKAKQSLQDYQRTANLATAFNSKNPEQFAEGIGKLNTEIAKLKAEGPLTAFNDILGKNNAGLMGGVTNTVEALQRLSEIYRSLDGQSQSNLLANIEKQFGPEMARAVRLGTNEIFQFASALQQINPPLSESSQKISENIERLRAIRDAHAQASQQLNGETWLPVLQRLEELKLKWGETFDGISQAVSSAMANVVMAVLNAVDSIASSIARISQSISSMFSAANSPTASSGSYSSTPDQSPYAKYASGGYVSGAGNGTSDSIPAWLSNGEYVIRAAAVRKLGTGFLDRLNGGMSRPTLGFAAGGLVAATSGSGRSFTLNIDGKSFGGLSGSNSVMSDLEQYAIRRQYSQTTKRAPGRIG